MRGCLTPIPSRNDIVRIHHVAIVMVAELGLVEWFGGPDFSTHPLSSFCCGKVTKKPQTLFFNLSFLEKVLQSLGYLFLQCSGISLKRQSRSYLEVVYMLHTHDGPRYMYVYWALVACWEYPPWFQPQTQILSFQMVKVQRLKCCQIYQPIVKASSTLHLLPCFLIFLSVSSTFFTAKSTCLSISLTLQLSSSHLASGIKPNLLNALLCMKRKTISQKLRQSFIGVNWKEVLGVEAFPNGDATFFICTVNIILTYVIFDYGSVG